MASIDSFGAKAQLEVGDKTYEIYRLDKVEGAEKLPYSLKILLENLLRTEDGSNITADDINALASWDAKAEPSKEIQFSPARVIMQDFTGVPAVVDLATMREAVRDLQGDPAQINPLSPAELVIDHSVIADVFGTPDSFERNVEIEYERNKERYQFLRWGQSAFADFKVVPPGTGIVHQVNIEHLARVVFERDGVAYPDTCVGTDSHTTMVNGLGVVGWGVGGIEAEAAMLGQPVSMLIPRVVGFKLNGELPEGTTATDLVLTITEMLSEARRRRQVRRVLRPRRRRGAAGQPRDDRQHVAGVRLDDRGLPDRRRDHPLPAHDRPPRAAGRARRGVRQGRRASGTTRTPSRSTPRPSSSTSPRSSRASPARSARRTGSASPTPRPRSAACSVTTSTPRRWSRRGTTRPPPSRSRRATRPRTTATTERPTPRDYASAAVGANGRPSSPTRIKLSDGTECEVDHGAVVIAAITSCTNTSNPSVMIGAALLAKKAVEKGLNRKPWVKTTLAPGSKVVMDYYERAGLTPYLEKLGFNLVGYGCTTCIGNSGPLIPEVSQAVNESDLAVVSVLSGNRNFEGRINPDVKMNYLASPPLVVAYALAGSMDLDIYNEPLGKDTEGNDVFLADIWPSAQEIEEVVDSAIASEMFTRDYADVFAGDERWQQMDTPEGNVFAWDDASTYVRKPPYFEGMPASPEPVSDIAGARVLAKLGDSVTTDHISPAGSIKKDSPAGAYLLEHGVEHRDFNSYGSRRGNHEVMIRGTFANIRLRNQLAPGTEGGFTRDFTNGGEVSSIYDASVNYAEVGTPLVILSGKEYGSGSSRDWAAKGTALLGVKAVLAESYERIHRSNLIGMGVLPLQYPEGENAESLGLTGEERFTITGVEELNNGTTPREVTVRADDKEFRAVVRIDTPGEADYFRHGGIMQYVLRSLLAK